jgi:hypothetical protein
MKKMKYVVPCMILLACSAWGQMANMDHATVASVLDKTFKSAEGEFVGAADAMPEDKYSFAPTSGEFKGVRTYAQQIKHVAAVNYLIGGAILGEKPPLELGGENGPDSVKTKADVMKFLKDSFVYAHKAMASIDEKNMVASIKSPFGQGDTTRLAMGAILISHPFDHYGQMVVYLRMNGIVPPASR